MRKRQIIDPQGFCQLLQHTEAYPGRLASLYPTDRALTHKLNVEYEATPNHVAMVTGALSMALSRVYAAWEKDPENAKRGRDAIAAWKKKQIAKPARGASCPRR